MSNKYSFAMVMDQHQQQGITELSHNYHTKRRASKPRTSAQQARSTEPALQSSPKSSKPRIRLRSSDESTRDRVSESFDQASEESVGYLRQACPWDESAKEPTQSPGEGEAPFLVLEEPIPAPPWPPQDQDLQSPIEDTHDSRIFPTGNSDPRVRPSSSSTGRRSTRSSSVRHHRRRGTTDTHATDDTAIWDPRPTSSSAQKGPAMTLLPVNKAPQPPLTPPLTPKVGSRNSQESVPALPQSMPCELDQSFEDLDIRPASSSKTHHSSSRSKSSISRPSTDRGTSSRPQTRLSFTASPPEPPRRRSSLRAPTSPEIRSIPELKQESPDSRPMPTSPHFSVTSRRSLDSFDLESDLTPLPPDLTTDPEFLESFPWTREGYIPGVSRILRYEGSDDQEAPDGLKNSHIPRDSFDSVAPPPIAMSKIHDGVKKPRGAPGTSQRMPGDAAPQSSARKQNGQPNFKTIAAYNSFIGNTAHNQGDQTSNYTATAYSSSGSSSGGKSSGNNRRKLVKQDPSNLNVANQSRPASTAALRSLQRSGYPPSSNATEKSREGLSSAHSMVSSNKSFQSGSSGGGSSVSGSHRVASGTSARSTPRLTPSRSKNLLSGVFPTKWGRTDSGESGSRRVDEVGSGRSDRSSVTPWADGGADARSVSSDGHEAEGSQHSAQDGLGVKSYRPSRPGMGVRHPSAGKKVVNIGGKCYVPEQLYREDEFAGEDGY